MAIIVLLIVVVCVGVYCFNTQRKKKQQQTVIVASTVQQQVLTPIPQPPAPVAVTPDQAALRRQWFEGMWTVKWEEQGTSGDMNLMQQPGVAGEIITWMGPADLQQYTL